MNLPTGLVCHVETPFKMLFSHNVLVPYEHNFSCLTLTGPTCFLQAHADLFFFCPSNKFSFFLRDCCLAFPGTKQSLLLSVQINVQMSLYSLIFHKMVSVNNT